MSKEEKVQNKNQQNNNKLNNNKEFNNNDFSNNLVLDLFDDNTLNISLEEEKPLFTELYTSVIEKITSVKKGVNPTNEFLSTFENLFKNQINIINASVKNNSPNFIYATNVLVAQIKIFSFFNAKYLEEYLSQSDPESAKILGLISENMFDSVNKLVDIIFKLGKKSTKINDEIVEIQNKVKQYDLYINELKDEKKILNEKTSKLKEENEFMTKKLINNNTKLKSKNKNDINNNRINNMNSSGKKQNINNINFINDSNIPNQSNIINNVSLTNLSIAGNRVFTLKMMKEVISNIYSSKTSFDQKCIQNKQAKQTMEEFMYTYLNQKYGLKNMVIEWATNIINGIRTFSKEDTEISLFGKILQNELEENCQLLIPNLKENINSILLNIIRSEYPYKNDVELNKYLKQYIKNELPPEITQQIIDDLFDEKGKEIIYEKISKEINNRKNIIMKNYKINGKYTREEINKMIAQKENECNFIQYDFLFDICLEYQIKLHIKYLKPLVKLFQSIDTDRDGVLNEEEFIELIKRMNIFGEDNIEQVIEEFLNNIDPYGYKHIIFSDIVDFFARLNYDENQTILDKFCIKDNNNNNTNINNNNDNNNNNNDNNDNNNNIDKDNNNDNNNIINNNGNNINENIDNNDDNENNENNIDINNNDDNNESNNNNNNDKKIIKDMIKDIIK